MVRDYERRAGLLAGLAEGGSANPRSLETLASTYINIGEARIEAGVTGRGPGRPAPRPGDARGPCADGAALDQTPADILANTHVFIGRALDRLDRPAEAAESFRLAFSLCEDLARDDPAGASHRRLLGMLHHVLGNMNLDLNRPSEAVERFRKAPAIRELLVRRSPRRGREPSRIMKARNVGCPKPSTSSPAILPSRPPRSCSDRRPRDRPAAGSCRIFRLDLATMHHGPAASARRAGPSDAR